MSSQNTTLSTQRFAILGYRLVSFVHAPNACHARYNNAFPRHPQVSVFIWLHRLAPALNAAAWRAQTGHTMQITQQSDNWRLPFATHNNADVSNNAAGSSAPSLGSASVHSSINAPATVATSAKGGAVGAFLSFGGQQASQDQAAHAAPQQGLAMEPSALSLAPATFSRPAAGTGALPVFGMGAENNDEKASKQAALREKVRAFMPVLFDPTFIH
jgi:hypothetical protein